jgi:hypothetical protein
MTPRPHVCTAVFVNGRWIAVCDRHPDTWGQPVFTDHAEPRRRAS